MSMNKFWMLTACFVGACASSFAQPAGATKPDFAVTALAVSPAVPVRGGTFTATVSVLNQGEVSGDAGMLRVWASKPGIAKAGEAGDAQQAVGTLAAGESRTFTFALAVPTRPGTHHARAFIDADGAATESNEGNNQKKTSYKPVAAGDQPLPAAVELHHLEQTYDGTEKTVVVSTDPAGLAVEVAYDGEFQSPVGAGTYQVFATVVDPNYEGSATGTLVVAKAPAVVMLANLSQVYDGTPKPVDVSTDPEGMEVEVVYANSEAQEGQMRVRSSSLPPVSAGRYSVEAVAEDENHEGTSGGTLEILPASQTIDFPDVGDRLTTDVVDLSATASSGLPVEFAVASGPARIEGRTLSFSGAGEVAIVASQEGDGNWTAAPDEVQSITVRKGPTGLRVSASAVHVRENGEGRFFVRLDQEPDGLVEVAVSRSSGDENIAVQAGAVRIFKPSNWNVWQAVTLVAEADENAVGETATFRVSAPGLEDQYVTATTLDGDVGPNLALPASGSTLVGKGASKVGQMVDGVHNVSTNYGWTIWTNVPPGTLTLDMKQSMVLGRIRLLNWDWIYRTQRYAIESSEDGANWSPLVDASGEDHLGWDDWELEEVSARYLRITGLTNTVNQCFLVSELEVYGAPAPLPQLAVSATDVKVRENGEGRFFVRIAEAPEGNVPVTVAWVSGDAGLSVQSGATRSFTLSTWSTWQAVTLGAAADENDDAETAVFRISAPGYEDVFVTATALDEDVGENLALASAGTTVSGRNSSRRTQLIDGVHAESTNYAYATWTAEPQGTIVLDLGSAKTVARIRLLNWDWIYRTQRYALEGSTDGVEWTLLADASGTDRQGWDDWPVAEQAIRYVRFTGLANSVNDYVLVSELEVYGPPPSGRRSAPTAAEVTPVTGTSVAGGSEPVSVLTSDGVADESGWNAVDGDWDSAWVGQKSGGGYVVVEYSPALVLSGLEVDLADDSLADLQFLYSTDAQDWQPLPDDLESNPVELKYLWVIFPDDGTDAVPRLLEIYPNP